MAVAATMKAAPKTPSGGYQRLVSEAVTALKETQGSSMQAISKYVSIQHPDIPGDKLKIQLRLAVKRMLEKETLRKIKASYKLTKTATKVAAPKKKAPLKKIKKQSSAVKKSAPKPAPSDSSMTKLTSKKKTVRKAPLASSKKAVTASTAAKPKTGTIKPKKTIAKKKNPMAKAPTVAASKKAAPKAAVK
jgi:linker histone H1 and H5 family